MQVVAYDPADATASQNPRSLASVESRLVLPFWYRLTQVVRENRQTDRQTDRHTDHATSAAAGRSLHPVHAMRPNTQGEMTTKSLWSRYDRRAVD